MSSNKPLIVEEKCLYCGTCADVCESGALDKGKVGYRIQVGGKLGRHPRLGKELPEIYDPEDALKIIDRCVEYYKRHCHRGERFGEILEKMGVKGELYYGRKDKVCTGKRSDPL